MSIKYLGMLGSFLAFVCSIPQVIMVIENGNANGLSLSMLWMWIAGMMSLFVYIYKTTKDKILMFQYFFISLEIVVLLYYSYFPTI